MILPALLLASLSAAPAPLPPLPSFAELRLAPPDPPPKALIRGTHYWVSNEVRHDLFRPAVLNRGGLLVGVGTDPNYLFAGWARSEAMILLDFDQSIADLHQAYGVLFARAQGPGDFLDLWTARRRREVERWIERAFPSAQERRRVRSAYRTAAPLVRQRLFEERARLKALRIASWLDDPEQFGHLQRLWRSGRVVAVRGDLVGPRTLAAIGRAAAEEEMTVGVLYLSNAEQYFALGERYRENLTALPMDERTVVLRTLGIGGLGVADGNYHYGVQAGLNLKRWLADGRAKSVAAMMRCRTPGRISGTSTLERDPESCARKSGPPAAALDR